MKRENFGFEYSSPKDSSRLVLDAELPEEVVLDRLKRIFSNISAMPAHIDEYDAAHPPLEVSVCLRLLFSIVVLVKLCSNLAICPFYRVLDGLLSSLFLLRWRLLKMRLMMKPSKRKQLLMI